MPFYKMEDLPRGSSAVGPATSHATAGELMKVGWVIYPQGDGPPPHFHPNEEQYILMLEGKMNMICGEEVREIGPGELVHIPRNTRHGIHITEGPAKFFAVKSPSGDGDLYQDYNKAEDADEAREKLESTL